MRDRRVRTLRRLGLTLLLLAAMIVSTVPVKAETIPPAFSDGEWAAKFSIYAVVPVESMTLKVKYLGDMQFNSSGGSLAGEWFMTGAGAYSGTVTGDAGIAAGGKVAGTSTVPEVTATSFIIDLNITVSGFPVTDQIDYGAGPQLGMTLISATCNQVTADVAAPAVANYQSAGIDAKVIGSFTAIRVGDLTVPNETDYLKEIGDVLDAAEALKSETLAQNGVDYEKLDELVTQANNLNLAMKKNIACGFGGEKTYLTIITDVVADLVKFALQNPELFTAGDLGRLLYAAVSVGAMGSGAANPQLAAELKAGFAQEFNSRLDDALTDSDCDQAVQILASAGSLGDADLKQEAQAVVDAIC